MNFPDRLAADAAFCEARLLVALEGRADQPVTQAMRYAARGGKRLRGFLVLEGARMLGVPEAQAVSAAAAVEASGRFSHSTRSTFTTLPPDSRLGAPWRGT